MRHTTDANDNRRQRLALPSESIELLIRGLDLAARQQMTTRSELIRRALRREVAACLAD
jgi:ribbon-helix-helix CopG family protein